MGVQHDLPGDEVDRPGATRGRPISDATVLDFWQWAFSDLRVNSMRGILAEWIVAKLLGIDSQGFTARDPWGEYDLKTPEGVTIAVKTSAYVQTWRDVATSRIVFSGLRGRTWSPESGYAQAATYNAHLYVFCVQIEKDLTRWNALDLEQWRFYVVPRDQLISHGGSSITLSVLKTFARELTASELSHEARNHIRALVPFHAPQSQ
jgi:hypothetical protein